MKRDLSVLEASDAEGIEEWLRLENDSREEYCPFGLQCRKCEGLLPRFTKVYGVCPCNNYPMKYLETQAKKFLAYLKGKKDEKDLHSQQGRTQSHRR